MNILNNKASKVLIKTALIPILIIIFFLITFASAAPEDGMLLVFNDTFTDTTGTFLTAHTPDLGTSWTEIYTVGGSNLQINTNELDADASFNDGSADYANIAQTWTADQLVQVTYSAQDTGDDHVHLLVRADSDLSNAYIFSFSITASDTYLWKRTDGTTNTQINTSCGGDNQFVAGDIVKLKAVGSSIEVYEGNTLVCAATDTDISSGRAGVGIGASYIDTGGDVSSQRADNLLIYINSPPDITALNYPANNSWLNSVPIDFNFTVEDDVGLANCTLYGNFNGSWAENETATTITNGSINNITISPTDGTYIWNVQCYDNASKSSWYEDNYTVNIDTTYPQISYAGGTLNNGTWYSQDWVFVNVSVSDTNQDTVTFEWNGNNETFDDNYYENKTSLVDGNYTFRAYVNDSAGNENKTELRIVYLDDTSPGIDYAGGTEDNGTSFNRNWVYVNVSVTETNFNNITFYLYNSTSQLNATNFTTLTTSVNFTALNSNEHYYYNVTVRDKASNSNSTETRKITLDTTYPSNITLNLPANNTNVSYQNLTFNFTAYDNLDTTLNCSIYFNGTLNTTNESVANGTLTNFNINNITEGSYEWNISCADSAGNVNWSTETRFFTIDVSAPSILSINFTPSSVDDIDPDVTLNVSVNLTDVTGVDTVIFQYKQPTISTYTNITMSYNSTSGIANASFTPDASGTWSYKAWANDTLGNSNTTITYNLSVEFDYTWTIPSSWDQVGCIIDTVCALGNLTINNTGDYPFNFDLSYTPSSITITYNDTEPFDLAAKGVKIIEVNATAPSTAYEYDMVITTDPSHASADPGSATTNVTFSVYTGGPYFDLSIPTYPTTALQSGSYNVSAKLRNIGNETANNVWINYTLQTGFSNTSGSLNKNISSLAAGATNYSNITITIATSVSPAIYTINVSAIGSGTSANTSDLASGSVSVSCSSTDGECGTGCSLATDSDCKEAAEPVTAAPVGGGGTTAPSEAAPSVEKVIAGEELFTTEETFELLRGEGNSFPIRVTNIYEELDLYNVSLTVEGYLSQYLRVTPLLISKIESNKSKEFTITITSPSYMKEGTYPLTFNITSRLIGVKVQELPNNVTITSYTRKDLVETRLVTLFIYEVGKEIATVNLEESEEDFSAIKESGFPITKIGKLLEEARKAFEEKNYKKSKELSERIKLIKKNAFTANELVKDVKAKILKAEDKGLRVEETKRLLNLALAAFEREDYPTAIQRAKDALLSIVIETKGKINIAKFIIDYWWPLLVAFIILSVSSYFVRKRLTLIIISRRLEDLQKEEITINELMKEIQQKYYKKKKISTTAYHKAMYGYEKRLGEVSRSISRLRSKRVGIIEISSEIRNLKKEDKNIIELIKQLQEAYFNRETITRKVYLRRIREYKLRRAEIENSIAVFEAKLAKKERLEELKEKEVPKKRIKTKKERRIRVNLGRLLSLIKIKKILSKFIHSLIKRKQGKEKLEKLKSRKLTKEQLEQIERKVEESSRKHPPVEDVLKELDKEIRAKKRKEQIKKRLQTKRFDKAGDRRIILDTLKKRFGIKKEAKKEKPKRVFKAEPLEEYTPDHDDVVALETYGFKVKSQKSKNFQSKPKSANKERVIKQEKDTVSIKEEDKSKHGIQIEETIPISNTKSKEDIIKNLKEVYEK